jgi:hypothetical protein
MTILLNKVDPPPCEYTHAHQTPQTAAEAAVGLVADLAVAAGTRKQLSEAQISSPASQIQAQQLVEQLVEVANTNITNWEQ